MNFVLYTYVISIFNFEVFQDSSRPGAGHSCFKILILKATPRNIDNIAYFVHRGELSVGH